MQDTSKTNLSYELFIGAIGVFSLLLLVCYILPLNQSEKEVAYIVNNFLALIFLFDFFRGLWQATHKLRYLSTGWLTLLGGIPFVPVLVLFRIWRVTNMVRYMRKTRQHGVFRTMLRSPAASTLMSTILLAIVVVTLSSMFVVSYEVDYPNSNIKSGSDALWWSLVTVATVGYGDRYPVTAGGRLIAIGLMVVGVGLFSVLSSYLASRFIRTQQEGGDELRQEITALRAQVAALQHSIDQITPATLDAPSPSQATDPARPV